MVINEQCYQLFAAILVCLVKAPDKRAVEVKHARDLPGVDQWYNQLGARSRVASDMAREIVDVADQNRRGP